MEHDFIANVRPMVEALRRLFARQESILHYQVNEILARNLGADRNTSLNHQPS